MTFPILLVLIIIMIAIVCTLLLTGKSDEDYSTSSKRNTVNLTVIYAVVIFLSLIGLAVYIKWFT
ncbi:hypothetical protein CU633_14590 [Bacillus sp. V3-13]|uniref:hypothetical protein n=1 Tax=Bacillus sp. V3-13 TaxID=2053728 RepID=UPI000C762462|nr:hypothetical protein [Bacillus sp. V3-13]PLR76577.1 hypothetical protein CU633_14590 [Bacillus sp. V3-13]